MFVKNHPAMKISEYLIVADLHIGITKDIFEKGVFMPYQSGRIAERLNALKKMTKTSKLVILGDLKHKVLGYSFHEKMELDKFFEALSFKTIIIVKGNHDGGIENMIPDSDKTIKVKKSLTIGDYCLTHGHRNIETKKKKIVIGHNQPHIRIRDDMGAYYVEPVWLKARLGGALAGKTLIMMPAFNELCGATVINKDRFLGPIAKDIITAKTKVYLLDGTDLGALTDFIKLRKRVL